MLTDKKQTITLWKISLVKKDYEKLTAVMKHPRDFLMYDFMLRDEMLL